MLVWPWSFIQIAGISILWTDLDVQGFSYKLRADNS